MGGVSTKIKMKFTYSEIAESEGLRYVRMSDSVNLRCHVCDVAGCEKRKRRVARFGNG